MAQVHLSQTDNPFTRQIASAIAKNAIRISQHINSGTSEEIGSHFESIRQLLEIHEAIEATKPAYITPLVGVRTRCGEGVPQ